ncbi:MAG: 3-phosphoserine/phosphohydroxythreonine transaminase [Chloracidobacterium sp.]|nr:3-phosphoserine/phosphohydroxythreonine transaminase [Chloracidobacterium sp.]MDW8217348.1 3-phosphoserine/phosphohydroxythreonine transaminase [Acidobacteriota bacterium]
MKRCHNFNAGPAVLPVPVLERIRDEMLSLPGVGMSVLEISHRSKTFENILTEAENRLRRLLKVPDTHHILFLQGGASLQFSMVPLNFLPKDGVADYIVTGSWSEKAVEEARKIGRVNIAATTKAESYARIPTQSELRLDPRAAYVHFTSNNTIFGTQWRQEPEVGEVPLVCDASSDFLSRPLEVSKYALIYAGAQKNAGPAGVTIVIVRDDWLARIPEGLPTMLDYRTHVRHRSLYNTPPVFAIYVVGLVLEYLETRGGLAAVAAANAEKAGRLYAAIDGSGFYRGTAECNSRSLMNVCFRLPNPDLEAVFLREAAANGFEGLAGHRSVGGIRASLYNALPMESVTALIDFMGDFARRHG